MFSSISLMFLFTLPIFSYPPQDSVSRNDFFVESEPGINIFVREVVPNESGTADGVPVLLIHGGGPGGIVSFDMDVPGYSLAEDLALAGHPVYIMDIRGWEKSTRPEALKQPPQKNPPTVPSEAAVKDISAVVDWIQKHRNGRKVALLGWATGGQWTSKYVSSNNEKVSHLITLNSLYGVKAPWAFEESCNSSGRTGAYRLVDSTAFLSKWSETIPLEDKSEWRDPRVAEAYVQSSLKYDPTSFERNPSSIRVPLAYFPESCDLAAGKKAWKASDIRVPALAIRGERDFWSRPGDLVAVKKQYINAPRVDTLTISGGTHYLFLDKPERGRQQFIDRVLDFLSKS